MEGLKGNAMISTPCKILSFIQQKKKRDVNICFLQCVMKNYRSSVVITRHLFPALKFRGGFRLGHVQ